jgi:hypothetical protein
VLVEQALLQATVMAQTLCLLPLPVQAEGVVVMALLPQPPVDLAVAVVPPTSQGCQVPWAHQGKETEEVMEIIPAAVLTAVVVVVGLRLQEPAPAAVQVAKAEVARLAPSQALTSSMPAAVAALVLVPLVLVAPVAVVPVAFCPVAAPEQVAL